MQGGGFLIASLAPLAMALLHGWSGSFAIGWIMHSPSSRSHSRSISGPAGYTEAMGLDEPEGKKSRRQALEAVDGYPAGATRSPAGCPAQLVGCLHRIDALAMIMARNSMASAQLVETSMSSSFNVRSANGYEQLMGRWSQKLAPLLIDFAGIADGERIVDVGCGTGSLTFALPQAADVSEIAAIDYSPVFVEEAKRRNTDGRISIQEADACALPFQNDYFDRALSLLVLHFVPEAGKAVSEMRRVVRPGGVVAAAVWDHLGGMPGMRMMVDTVAALDESGRQLRSHYCFQPMMRPDEMKQSFIEQGLPDVEQASLLIRMEYRSFEDYWAPIAAGEGPLGKYVAALDPAKRAETDAAVRAAYEAGQPDGPRSFAAVAWACRGVVPSD
jgi:SAM-dependent methyltransferase